MRRYTTDLAGRDEGPATTVAAPAMAQNEAPTLSSIYDCRSPACGLEQGDRAQVVCNDHGDKLGTIDDIMLPAMGGRRTSRRCISVGGFSWAGARRWSRFR